MFGGLMRSGKMREAMINALKIRQEKPAAKPAPKKKKPAGTVPAAARTKAQVEQEKKKRTEVKASTARSMNRSM